MLYEVITHPAVLYRPDWIGGGGQHAGEQVVCLFEMPSGRFEFPRMEENLSQSMMTGREYRRILRLLTDFEHPFRHLAGRTELGTRKMIDPGTAEHRTEQGA